MKIISVSLVLSVLVFLSGCMNTDTVGIKSRESNKVAYISDIDAATNALTKTYACFELPINYQTSTTFNGFELKGTLSNYQHDLNEYQRLTFYSQSELADQGISVAYAVSKWTEDHPGQVPVDEQDKNGSLDRMWLFTCSVHPSSVTTNFNGDTRSYKYIGNTAASGGDGWGHQILTVIAIVDVEALERHREDNGNWLNNNNDNLSFSWIRYSYTSGGDTKTYEVEQGTTTPLWRPVTPVRWYKEMPKWARDQIGDYWPREKQASRMPL